MKLCVTCKYQGESEYNKPCIIRRDDCKLYERKVKKMRLIDADNFEVVSFKDKSKDFCDGAMTILEMLDSTSTVQAVPMEVWNELRETIIELRDSGGTCNQQEVSKFLLNLMEVLESR